jgi:Rieske 2Fe-2S family protein
MASEELRTEAPLAEAHTLPGRFYYDPGLFEEELQKIFYRSWLYVCREEDLSEPGSFVVRSIGGESVILVRDEDRRIRAFYNVCRHRGARLLKEGRGAGLKNIRCSYHAWTYALDGRLIGAPHTAGLKGFRREEYGLIGVRCDAWGGFIFINLDERAEPLSEHLGDLVDRWRGLDLSSLRRARKAIYQVKANWKVIAENYSECYHCPSIHPELNRITFYRDSYNDKFFMGDEKRGQYNGGWMVLAEGCESMTLTGKSNRPPLKGLGEEDRRRIYYYLIFPNMFFSLHPDYLMVHTVWPEGPTSSIVECEWLFDRDVLASEGFYGDDAIQMWDMINRQDWEACELTQLGVQSRGYRQGRYSEIEGMVHDFDRFYLKRMGLSA